MFDAFIKSGLIEPKELHALLNGEQSSFIRMLDASFVMPGMGDHPSIPFQKTRIADAQFFDIDEIADKSSNLPHMMPTPDVFAHAVGAMGTGNENLVVIYGQDGIVMGPARAWWMFRAFGHDNVCILNGGLPAWKAASLPLNTQPPPIPTPTIFKATFRDNMVIGSDTVIDASNDNTMQILDARPPGRFSGAEEEPRPGLKRGHIPASLNIPAGALIDAETGKLKAKDALAQFLEEQGYRHGTPVLTTCGSGVTACVIALAIYHLHGNQFPFMTAHGVNGDE